MQHIGRIVMFMLSSVIIAAAVAAPPANVPTATSTVPAWACSMSSRPQSSQVAPGHMHFHAQKKQSSGGVTEVDHASLVSLITNRELLLVAFFAPWCPHCQDYVLADNAPLKSLNEHLLAAGGPKVVQFDTEASPIPSEFSVVSIPTIYLVTPDGASTKRTQYPGNPFDLQALMAWAMAGAGGANFLAKAPNSMLTARPAVQAVTVPSWACSVSSAMKVGPWSAQSVAGQVHLHVQQKLSNGAVTKVDKPSLLSLMANNESLLVTFFAPWCGHCQQFVMADNAPLKELNTQLIAEQGPKVVQFNITASEIPDQFVVTVIPTIYLVSANGAITKYAGNPNDITVVKAWAMAGAGGGSLLANTPNLHVLNSGPAFQAATVQPMVQSPKVAATPVVRQLRKQAQVQA